MVNPIKVSKYTEAGILLMLCGLLVLAIEDMLWDESLVLTTLYLLPIGFFLCSFVTFLMEPKATSNN